MSKIFGYTSITTPQIRRTDPEARKATKAYAQLEEIFRLLNLQRRKLYIDLLTARYRVRKELKTALSISNPGDIMIIPTASSLGRNPEELRDNYYKVVSKSIGLLVWDEMPRGQELERLIKHSGAYHEQPVRISTVGLDLNLPTEMYFGGHGVPYIIARAMRYMDQVNIRTFKGAAFKKRPALFKEIYWLYENYFIREQDAFSNDAIEIGKKRFYRLATEYEEEDPEYEEDQKEQERLYQISKKPKRRGLVPDHYDEFLKRIDSGERLETVIKEMSFPRLTPIDVERYRLKYEGGKRQLALASYIADTPQAKELVKKVMERGKLLSNAGRTG